MTNTPTPRDPEQVWTLGMARDTDEPGYSEEDVLALGEKMPIGTPGAEFPGYEHKRPLTSPPRD